MKYLLFAIPLSLGIIIGVTRHAETQVTLESATAQCAELNGTVSRSYADYVCNDSHGHELARWLANRADFS